MKIVFLDIDGVLQPFGASERFNHVLDEAVEDICRETGDGVYRSMDKYDVGAAKWDWDASAVGLLKELLDATGAVIVVESDWRLFNDERQMAALLRLQGLDGYYAGNVPEGPKDAAIGAYLEEHDGEIESYVVIDDRPVTGFGNRQVQTRNKLSADDAGKAIEILAN